MGIDYCSRCTCIHPGLVWPAGLNFDSFGNLMSETDSSHQPMNWYAVMVRPGHEKFASRAFRNRGYDEFMPQYRERRRWSDRIKELQLPLFPGYLFCRFDPAERMPILTAPAVSGIVSFGGVPTPIDEAEVSRVKAFVNAGQNPQPWPYLKTGDRILIGSGPLSGMEAILIHYKNQYRLVASVTLLQRSVAVEIDADSVITARPSR